MKQNTMADKKRGKSQVGHAADWLEDLINAVHELHGPITVNTACKFKLYGQCRRKSHNNKTGQGETPLVTCACPSTVELNIFILSGTKRVRIANINISKIILRYFWKCGLFVNLQFYLISFLKIAWLLQFSNSLLWHFMWVYIRCLAVIISGLKKKAKF